MKNLAVLPVCVYEKESEWEKEREFIYLYTLTYVLY